MRRARSRGPKEGRSREHSALVTASAKVNLLWRLSVRPATYVCTQPIGHSPLTHESHVERWRLPGIGDPGHRPVAPFFRQELRATSHSVLTTEYGGWMERARISNIARSRNTRSRCRTCSPPPVGNRASRGVLPTKAASLELLSLASSVFLKLARLRPFCESRARAPPENTIDDDYKTRAPAKCERERFISRLLKGHTLEVRESVPVQWAEACDAPLAIGRGPE